MTDRTAIIIEEPGKVLLTLKEGSTVAAVLPVSTREGAERIAETWRSGSMEFLAE